ncbi:hypothetical protein BDW69DRAFT_183506 [Aspergillus filifer]
MYSSNPSGSNNGDENGQRAVHNPFGIGQPMTLAFRPTTQKNNRAPAPEQWSLNAEANPFPFNPGLTPRSASALAQTITTLSPRRLHFPRGHPGYSGLGHWRRHSISPCPSAAAAYTPYPIGTSIMGPEGGPNPAPGPLNYLTGAPTRDIGMRRALAQYPPGQGNIAATPARIVDPLPQRPPAPTPALPATPQPTPADHPTVAPHLMLVPTQDPLPPPSRPYATRANAAGYSQMWNCCGCGDGPNSNNDNMCFGCHHTRCHYCANIWA